MLKKISRARLDALRQGWLESRRHLPAARFGPLTALDDSLIRPHTGFNTHPDKNEVLLYYIANGELTHGDSLNNHSVLRRGEALCLHTGTGLRHSGSTRAARRCVWSDGFFACIRAAHPTMESSAFVGNREPVVLLACAAPEPDSGPLFLSADANVYAADLTCEARLAFPIEPGRQVYLLVVEGAAEVNGIVLEDGDALSAFGEPLQLSALPRAHILLVEAPQY
ncbi:MAG: pirin family protein [Ruthenibacterium lactatiformans]